MKLLLEPNTKQPLLGVRKSSLFKETEGLYLKTPERPSFDNTKNLYSISDGVKPYIWNPELIREKTEDIEEVFKEANKKLKLIVEALLDKEPKGLKRQLTNQELYNENLPRLLGFLDDVLKNVQLTTEEEKVINEFKESIVLFPELIKILPDVESLNVSEELIRLSLAHLPHYFQWVSHWLDSKHVLDRYESSKEQALESTKVENKQIKILTPVEFPKEKLFTGKIWKEKNEGNSLYVSSYGQVLNEKGEVSLECIGKKSVVLKDLKELSRRKKGEIDIELPIYALSKALEESSLALPTCLGFKAIALSYLNNEGNEIKKSKIKSSQDALGVTYINLNDIPKDARSIKYRLKKSDLNPMKNIPDLWSKNISFKNPRQDDELFIEAIKLQSNLKDKISLLKEMVKNYNPIYTTSLEVQKIARESENFVETQLACGLMHKCDGLSIVWNALLRNYTNVPSLMAYGLTLEESLQGVQFRLDAGHVQPVWFDEENLPHTIEATTLCTHRLDEEKLKEDLSDITLKIKTKFQDEVNKLLLELSPSWRTETIEEDDDSSNSLDEFNNEDLDDENLNDNTTSRESNLRELYTKAIQVKKVVNNFSNILKDDHPITVKVALIKLDSFIRSRDLLGSEHSRGQVHLPIIRLKREIKKCKSDFIEWCKMNPKKRDEVLDCLYQFKSEGLFKISSEFLRPLISQEYLNVIPGAHALELLNRLDIGTNPNDDELALEHMLYAISQKVDIKEIENAYNNILRHPFPPEVHRSSFEWFLKHCLTQSNTLSQSIDILRLKGESCLEKILLPIIRDKITNINFIGILKTYYATGKLNNYLENKDGKIILKEDFKKKVVENILQGDFIKWNYESYIKNLESCGIDLRQEVSNRKQFTKHIELIQDGYWFHILEFLYNKEQASNPGIFWCNYFNIPYEKLLTKEALKTLWNKEGQFCLDGMKAGLLLTKPYFEKLLAPYLEKEKCNDLSEVIKTQITYPHSHFLKVLLFLGESLPEAKVKIEDKLQYEMDCLMKDGIKEFHKKLIKEIHDGLSSGTQHQFKVLKQMIEESGEDEIILKEFAKLNEHEKKFFSFYLTYYAIEKLPKDEDKNAYDYIVENVSKSMSLSNLDIFQTTSMIVREILSKSLKPVQEEELEKIIKNILDKLENENSATDDPSKILPLIGKEILRYKKENYPVDGVRLIQKAVKSNSNSFWWRQLVGKVITKSSGREIYVLSEANLDFETIQEAAHHLGNVTHHTKSLFNSQTPYLLKIKDSGMQSRSTSGDWFSLKEVSGYVPQKDIVQSAYARTGKLIVAEKKESTEITPYHYVVDLECLSHGEKINSLSGNLYKLMSELHINLAKKTKQNLHLFYRGQVISFTNEELQDMLSHKMIDDKLGRRTNVVDFILQLQFLVEGAKNIDDDEPDDYKCGSLGVPNSGWIPLGENGKPKGTAIVLTNNKDTIQASIPTLQAWSKEHIEVRVPDLKTS